MHRFIYILNICDFESNRHHTGSLSELDTIRQEIHDDLTETAFISENLLEVEPIDRIIEKWSEQINLLEHGLTIQHFHAVFCQLNAIKVLILQLECVIIHLSMIHKVFHENHHHIGLVLHACKLLVEAFLLFDVVVDESNQAGAFFEHQGDELAELRLGDLVDLREFLLVKRGGWAGLE